MNAYITTLFNKGDNDGELTIFTKDGSLKCHAFIIKYCTDFPTDDISDNHIKFEEYSTKIVTCIVDYLYTQDNCCIDLTCDEIIDTFKFVDTLKCKNFIRELKLSLSSQFLKMISMKNWICYFDMLYGNQIFIELNDLLLQFYNKNILLNSSMVDNDITEFTSQIKKIKNDAVYDLLINTLNSFFIRNQQEQLKNLNNTKEQEVCNTEASEENLVSEGSNEDEDEDDEEDEEEVTNNEYSDETMIELLKDGQSFKQISETFSLDRELIANNFINYINKNDKGKKLETIMKKYGINSKNDKVLIEKTKKAKPTVTNFF